MTTNCPGEQALKAVERAGKHARNYVETIHDRRVAPSTAALRALAEFDETLPLNGRDAREVIDLLHTYASPATVATTGGRFFGLVVGGSLPASMGAAMLSAAWDQVAILDATAPSATHLERLAARWTLDLLGLTATCSVGFCTGSSMANLIGLAAARNAQYHKLGVSVGETGVSGAPPLRVVLSDQAHVTVVKALQLLGIGNCQLIRVPCDAQGRMRVEAFPEVGRDTIVCLQAGNVNSGASDPFVHLVSRAQAQGAWVHVDGAFGLWAAASPQLKAQVAGVELADSWAVDAHKWLNTPYDCGLAICRYPSAVHEVMTTIAPYLQSGQVVPPKDMVPEFSRRARGVEVWAALQELGRQGVEDLLNRTCLHARTLAVGLRDIGFDVLNDVVLNQVVATIGDAETVYKITQSIQAEGECWFGSTVWRGCTAIRLSVSSWATTEEDIQRTLRAIRRAVDKHVGVAI